MRPTADLILQNFIDAATLLDETKSSRINLGHTKKIKWILNQT